MPQYLALLSLSLVILVVNKNQLPKGLWKLIPSDTFQLFGKILGELGYDMAT